MTDKRGLKSFILYPYYLHRRTPNWIAPLRLEQRDIFNPSKNSVLRHCDYRYFLLYDGGRVIGRILAYINHTANQYLKEKTGYFGHYECIDDPEAARLLLQTAEDWLREQGMQVLRGPWNLASQDMGFICEGFQLPPIVMSSFNPPYYNDQVIDFGMQKAKDLLVYEADFKKGYRMPERFRRFTDKISQRYGVTVRPINMKNLVEDTRTIVYLTNESLKDNWGFYPIEESEAEQIAADLKMIVHPEVVLIAEVEGKPIGYVITLPDVNHILKDMKGKLFPTGIFKLLCGVKKINRYRVWAMGILPQYQRKGIAVLMIRRIDDVLAPRGSYVEINWILEDNDLMNNTVVKLNFEQVKRYRIYEKKIK